MRRWGVFWGLVLVLFGGLLLAGNLGLLPVASLSLLWPLLLVLLGLWIVLGAFTRRRAPNAEVVRVPLQQASAARVVVKHGAGRLEVAGGAPAGELYEGEFAGLSHREWVEAGVMVSELKVDEDWTRWEWGSRGIDWRLRLTEQTPLALELHLGASENTLDLTRVRLTSLQLDTGASSTDIALPAAAGETRVRVQTGAASVRLRVPVGVAARVTGRAGLASIDVDTRRFPRTADGWESPDYASAANRVEIHAEVGVGSVAIS